MVSKRAFDLPAQYSIRIFGALGEGGCGWFEELQIEEEGDGVTKLTGEIADQSALHGILTRVRDLGLPLLAVERLPSQMLGREFVEE